MSSGLEGLGSLIGQISSSELERLIRGGADFSKVSVGDGELEQLTQNMSENFTIRQDVTEPWVSIEEQPRQRGMRFRYECEGRSAGSIPGENNTSERRTFPTIKIHNHTGTAVVVVSCCTKDTPAKPHPHALVGKDCAKGVCTIKVKDSEKPITFPNLGIQCAKRKEVQEALSLREQIRVDPFQTGFKHKGGNIDLNVVKLCFQAFLPDTSGKYTRIVAPICSNPIFDKKAVNDLVICRVDRHSGSVRGSDEVFLLCEKVQKEDIQVRFYEESDSDGVMWEAYGDFGQMDVHRQVAVVFKTPKYRDLTIHQPVTVMMQLKRPSDQETSDPKPFQYMPDDTDPEQIDSKRRRKKMAFTNDITASAPFQGYTGMPMYGDHAMNTAPTSQQVKDRLKLKASRGRHANAVKIEDEAAIACQYTGQPVQATADPPINFNQQQQSTYSYASLSNTSRGVVTVATQQPDNLAAQFLTADMTAGQQQFQQQNLLPSQQFGMGLLPSDADGMQLDSGTLRDVEAMLKENLGDMPSLEMDGVASMEDAVNIEVAAHESVGDAAVGQDGGVGIDEVNRQIRSLGNQ